MTHRDPKSALDLLPQHPPARFESYPRDLGILGHSQISLTMSTHAHLSPALEHDAAWALDAVLAGTAGVS